MANLRWQISDGMHPVGLRPRQNRLVRGVGPEVLGAEAAVERGRQMVRQVDGRERTIREPAAEGTVG